MRITEEEYKALLAGRPIKEAKPAKYRNVKTEIDGIVFDSKKEAAHYHVLKLRERAGEIHSLELQPEYKLCVNGMLVCKYFPDFRYVEGVARVVEDVKSKATKTPVYNLKIKLMKACLGIEVQEI